MKIYAPNIHLFAFQLYKGSNLEPNSLQVDDIFLWKYPDKIVSTTLGKQDLHFSDRIDVHKEPNSLRVDLLKESEVKDGDYSLPFVGKISLDDTQQVLIKGFAHPLRLYDSHAMWLNLRRPEKEDDGTPTEDVDISLLSKLNIDNCLTLDKTKLFLGQTLLITAWLTGAKDKQNLNTIAEECLKSVFHNHKLPPLNRQGELFGSPIFEYGLFSQQATYQHVLIWLFNDEKADEKFNQCYQELLDLFFFRTKVVKAFQDSRAIYHEVAASYQEIEDLIDNLPQINVDDGRNPVSLRNRVSVPALTTADLNKLKKDLKDLPQLALKYTRLLRNLEEYQNTIAINEYNYSERLRQIGSIIQGGNLHFLEIFTEENSSFFQKQIQGDLGYFRHGSLLLEQAIASIRGIVEIEQAERDRSLEKTIQVLGVGLGAGAIVSGVVTQHIDTINQPLSPISHNNPPHPFYASLLLSILATLFFSGLAWLWTQRK